MLERGKRAWKSIRKGEKEDRDNLKCSATLKTV
jgi:hypothetical protein